VSWIDVPAGSDFPIENLPYGAFSTNAGPPHLGVAVGEDILDLYETARAGLFDGFCDRALLEAPTLNALLAAGKETWQLLRGRLRALLARGGDPALRERNHADLLIRQKRARMHVPANVGDYVDFYSSEQHAINLGRIFRPDGAALFPNWKWMPIGYHGRAGSIVIDGTPVVHPRGQRKPLDAPEPVFAESAMLDFELEIGFFTGTDDIFGVVLVNDWSARDIQAWEYQPLGPFLGKSFATTISPWVVTLEALAPFRVPAAMQDPQPLPHLRVENDALYDIKLSVELETEAMRARGMPPAEISHTNARELYWTFAQQLAHVRSNGTDVRPGDLFASGTISGADPKSYGSLIELTWRGKRKLTLPSGEQRAFLEDGDEVIMRGWCEKANVRVGFGSCSGRIVPAYAGAGVSSQER
jgi:fumarylacetoacetase